MESAGRSQAKAWSRRGLTTSSGLAGLGWAWFSVTVPMLPVLPRGRGHSTRPGACHSVRGRSTPSGTGFLSPYARHVPGREKMHPHAQDVPRRRGMPPAEGRMRCGRCGTARSRLPSDQVGASRAATSSSCAAISVKSRSRSRVRTWKRCPVSVQVSRTGGSTAVWA